MPDIQLSRARLYYEDEGRGKETIVFGHSMLFNLRMFDDQVERLKSSYRCIRFDFRGQGKSEITPDGYDLETLAEDIVELIQALNAAPCHFVGFSMGGMVGLRLALSHPELIRSLVLIDTSSEPEPPETGLRNKLLLWVTRNLGLKPVAPQVLRLFFGKPFLKDPGRKELQKKWKNYFLANDRIGITRVVKGVLDRQRVTSQLGKIKAPTLVMVGENDLLTPPDQAAILQAGIPGAELLLIPRAGHMSPVEEPELVTEYLSKFLSKF